MKPGSFIINGCIAVCICMLAFFSDGRAQSMEKRLEKIMLKSDGYLKKKRYEKAERHLRYSVNEVQQKDIVWARLGKIAAERKNYEAAAEYYLMAMNFRPENKDVFILHVIDNLFMSRQYLDAEYYFMQIVPSAGWHSDKAAQYNKYKSFFSNKNIIYSNLSDSVYIENAGSAINSEYPEYYPSLSHDDSTMIFTRRFNWVEEDFFIVHRDSCMESWYAAEHMGYPPNSSKNEGAQCLSYDRNYIYLMRCDNPSMTIREAGGCDLYLSYARGGEWIPPVAFGATINTKYFEGMPSFSSDNKTLYFVSDRPGGYGGLDIWKTEFGEKGWSVPENLGPHVNTEKDEISPFIAADNQTLYFSSNGHVGLGGYDIFVSRRNGTREAFGKPVNLGMPYNTAYDEISWFLLANGEKAYFASDRPGGYGSMDIYTTNVLPAYQPGKTTFIYGTVLDKVSGDTITNAQMEIYDEEGDTVQYLKSNPGDGSFFLALQPYKTYYISARRYDYPKMTYAYFTNIISHHPPVDMELQLIHWRDKDQAVSEEDNQDEAHTDNMIEQENEVPLDSAEYYDQRPEIIE